MLPILLRNFFCWLKKKITKLVLGWEEHLLMICHTTYMEAQQDLPSWKALVHSFPLPTTVFRVPILLSWQTLSFHTHFYRQNPKGFSRKDCRDLCLQTAGRCPSSSAPMLKERIKPSGSAEGLCFWQARTCYDPLHQCYCTSPQRSKRLVQKT